MVEHPGTSSDVPLVPTCSRFVDYVLSIANADCALRVVQAHGDDVEGVNELSGPPESPPTTQVEGALSATEESVQATPTPLEGKEASAEQSMESPEARPQPSMATPIEDDTCPKVLIRGEWRKCPMAIQQMHLASCVVCIAWRSGIPPPKPGFSNSV